MKWMWFAECHLYLEIIYELLVAEPLSYPLGSKFRIAAINALSIRIICQIIRQPLQGSGKLFVNGIGQILLPRQYVFYFGIPKVVTSIAHYALENRLVHVALKLSVEPRLTHAIGRETMLLLVPRSSLVLCHYHCSGLYLSLQPHTSSSLVLPD